jgi:hypothetical protein
VDNGSKTLPLNSGLTLKTLLPIIAGMLAHNHLILCQIKFPIYRLYVN